jgi:signal transduction histidine kinase/ligand-binding sensor domain-containing protein
MRYLLHVKLTGLHSRFLLQFLKHILVLFAILCLAVTAESQDQYRIIHLDLEQGLSIGFVNCIIKDQLGFVWMGTMHGLNRFDGNRFVNYFENRDKRNSIAGGGIYGLIEDSLHNIWIGTDNGLSRYDIKADSFTNFLPETNLATSSTFVIPFWATGGEVLCFESESRIVAYNIKSKSRRVLLNHFDNDENRDYLRFHFSVLDSNSQSVWMLAKGGLLEISLTTGKQSFYAGNYFDAPVMHYDLIRKLIWLNTTGGLLSFSIKDKQFHTIEAMKSKDYDPYAGLSIDRQGKIWAGTVKKGILIYNPSDNSVHQPFPDSVSQQMVSQANMCIYCDRLGIAWTGNWALKGVFQLNPFSASVRRYTIETEGTSTSQSIGGLVNGPNGTVWIGTQFGLDIFNPNTNLFQKYKSADCPGITGKDISVLLFDTARRKALITSGPPYSLIEMDLNTRQFQNIIFRDSLNQNISLGTYDLVNNIANSYQGGAVIYLKNKGIFNLKKDSTVAREVIALKQENVTSAFLSPDGHLFLHLYGTTYNRTYINRGEKWIRSASVLDSIGWSAILYDLSDQSYWVGETKRLIHYDNQMRSLYVYGEKEGFTDISALCILKDLYGNIWFNNSKGDISRLSISSGKIITLSGKDGLLKQRYDWNSPHIRDASGDLYFAGNIGIDRVSPSKLQEKYPPSTIYLHSLEINNEPVSIPTGLNELTELNLNYFQNSINLEMEAIDFFSKTATIRYKVGGISENWQYSTVENPIRLDGVSPGTYKISIQASDAFNEYNGPEKIILVHINPPWWKTWWSYGLMMLIAALILWTFIQYRSRQLKLRNRELEEKVLSRTKELKYSLEELKETQDQLVQREKMASLGELTAGIAHEIQNPLNFVNNFSEVNIELAAELNSELGKMDLPEKDKLLLGEIAENIADNEQKINHHGKRADAIVKGMLQHSRTNAGTKELTDINALADEYLRLAYHGMRAKNNSFNVTIKTDFDDTIGKVNIVPQDIGRVLLNTYNNSFYSIYEKTKQGIPGYDPTIIVSTKFIEGNIEIRIRDNGLGIPEKIKDKIFQPFFTTKPTGQGTGLGLSLSFDIVKAHGGVIKIESKENEFAEFVIQFPDKLIRIKNDIFEKTNNV